MHIEFTCLHCGHRLKVSAEKAGSRGDCPGCGAGLTVPQPIGGKLTDKRLQNQLTTVATAAGAQSIPAAPSQRPATARREVHPGDVERRDGLISVNWQNNALCRRTELDFIEGAAQAICDALYQHMQLNSQSFESASFILDVQRFDVSDERSDANVRLVGWLNGEEFTETVSVWFSAHGTRSPLFLLLQLMIPGLKFRGLQQAVLERMRDAIDEAAGCPLGLWRRCVRAVRTAFHG